MTSNFSIHKLTDEKLLLEYEVIVKNGVKTQASWIGKQLLKQELINRGLMYQK
jgi:hypothetical protein